MKNAVRLHCHSAPNAGSETDCGLPTDTVATSTTAEIASIAQVVFITGASISTAPDIRLAGELVHNLCSLLPRAFMSTSPS
jgi:hypothetical protein